MRDRLRQLRAAGPVRQVPERTLVDKPQVKTIVDERKPSAQVWCVSRERVPDQQLSAHPKVSKQRIFAHGKPEVFTAPVHAGDGAALQGGRQVVWPADVPPHRTRMKNLGPGERPALDVILKAGPYALDFWKFRHCRPRANPRRSPRQAERPHRTQPPHQRSLR